MDRFQSWMDRFYRYVWSNKDGQLLRQMSERGENMTDFSVWLVMKSRDYEDDTRKDNACSAE